MTYINRWTHMKAYLHLLAALPFISPAFAQDGATGQSAPSEQMKPIAEAVVTPLGDVPSRTWRAMASVRSRNPISTVTITNAGTQKSILSAADAANVRHGIDRYVDLCCGFGALLSREYVGAGYLVSVSFQWDGEPDLTVIALHGLDHSLSNQWTRSVVAMLEEKLDIEKSAIRVHDTAPEPSPAAAVLESSESLNPQPENEAPADGSVR